MANRWIASFLIKTAVSAPGHDFACRCVQVEASWILEALTKVEEAVRKVYPTEKYFVHDIGVMDAEDRTEEGIYDDPVMEPGDFEDIVW